MSGLLTSIITLLGQIAPIVADSSKIASIINILIQIIPTLVKEAQDLVQPVKNIIAALQINAATTQAQMDTLKALDATVDAAFEAAATDVTAQDG